MVSRTPDPHKPRVDPEKLPPVFPVQVCSKVLGVGRNQTYDLIRRGEYPVRVLTISGRFKVTRYDLLRFLGADRAETEVAS